MGKKKTKNDPLELTPIIKKFKVGAKDLSGNVIADVLAMGPEYCIYEIESEQPEKRLRFIMDGHTSSSEYKMIERFNKVRPLYVLAKGLLYRASNFNLMKIRVAHALVTALTTEGEESKKHFEALIDQINSEHLALVWSRAYFLMPAYLLLLIQTVAVILITLSNSNNLSGHLYTNLMIGLSSNMGGAFSLTFTLRQRQFEAEIHPIVYAILGLERVILAIMAGFIAYFGIKSNLILGILNDNDSNFYAILFITSLAGFSETFLPNLLERFIKNTEEKPFA